MGISSSGLPYIGSRGENDPLPPQLIALLDVIDQVQAATRDPNLMKWKRDAVGIDLSALSEEVGGLTKNDVFQLSARLQVS
jgi:hypothetical protein